MFNWNDAVSHIVGPILHLTVASDGIVSLWDRPTVVDGETNVSLVLTVAQREELDRAQSTATKPNQATK